MNNTPLPHICTSIEAARWVSKAYVGKSRSLRQVAAVAGKVTSQPGADTTEVIAAWVYRPCEDRVTSLDDQEHHFTDIGVACGVSVEKIVRELVAPFGSNDGQCRAHFLKSGAVARRIRIAEILVGLDDSFMLMYGGAMVKADEVSSLLKFAKFVYESSPGVSTDILRELASMIVGIENMWNAIVSTMESFERNIGSPDMITVRLIALANELGGIKVATFEGDVVKDRVKAAFDSLREEIGGTIFTETLLHATVPLPKVGTLRASPAPTPSLDIPEQLGENAS